jgi:hypothetical protein
MPRRYLATTLSKGISDSWQAGHNTSLRRLFALIAGQCIMRERPC